MSEEASKQEAALGFSITANINGDRQVVFQSFIGRDDPDKVANEQIDRVMRLIDRQQAIFEIPPMRAEITKLEAEALQYEKDAAAVEADHKAWEANTRKALVELQMKRDASFKEGYDEHASSERRGEYKPSGHRASLIGALDRQMEKISEEVGTKDAEREVALNNLKTNNQMRRNRIEQLKGQIADAEKRAA